MKAMKPPFALEGGDSERKKANSRNNQMPKYSSLKRNQTLNKSLVQFSLNK
jgi:hypothetical protein